MSGSTGPVLSTHREAHAPTNTAVDRFHQEVLISVGMLACMGAPEAAVNSAGQGPSLTSEGFSIFPIKIAHHSRQYFQAIYDSDGVRAVEGKFALGAIFEAIRNVYQHGHSFDGLPEPKVIPGDVHAAIALKEISVPGSDGSLLTVLLASVMDAGPGLQDPEHNLVDGIGNIARGEQRCGMGIELQGSLVYVVKSRSDGWFVFDGLAHSKNWPKEVDVWSQEARDARIEALGQIDLPRPTVGCQKIFFLPAKESSDAERQWLKDRILEALSPYCPYSLVHPNCR